MRQAMAFPPNFIERLRHAIPVSRIIGARVALKRHGREHMGLCPFHREKSPSFTVNDEKGFFHCFGCAAHGDAIEFLRRYEHISYREAVESLAREAGLAVPEMTPQVKAQMQKEKTLIDAMEAAAKFYEHHLSLASGMRAREYLAGRGILPPAIAQFRLGIAPDGREALKTHLLAAGFTLAQLIEAGLVIQIESGMSYDRFRGRLMFPIRDEAGRVIAFGGRLIGPAHTTPGGHTPPKYLNSPETPLFKKGEVLFNLDQARKYAREKGELVMVEGYMDVVALAQAGIGFAVATLGTAVTPHHLQRIWNLVKEPVICLDSDDAGKRAMQRAAELALPLLKPGLSLRFAMLPAGEDPDSLVRSLGAAGMLRYLHEARRLSETLWDMTSAAARLQTPEGRAELEQTLIAYANRIEDSVMRGHYRSFFRGKLWPAQTAAKSVPKTPSFGGLNARASGTMMRMDRSAQVEHMARGLTHESGGGPVQTVMRQLMALLLLQPSLLEQSDCESELIGLELHDSKLDRLRHMMLELTAHADTVSHEWLIARLVELGMGEVASSLLASQRMLAKSCAHSIVAAQNAWVELVGAYRSSMMEEEYRALQAQMEAQPTDALLERFTELQRALHEIQRGRRFSAVVEPQA